MRRAGATGSGVGAASEADCKGRGQTTLFKRFGRLFGLSVVWCVDRMSVCSWEGRACVE